MNDVPLSDGIMRYYQVAQDIQKRVLDQEHATLKRVASLMADVIRNDGRIFLFGTGHSHMLLEEAFFRAGGLAAATPIFVTNLMLHEDPSLSGHLERVVGLAAPILDRHDPRPGEILFVISNSGVNALPVEMALEGRNRGLTVVAVCSRAYAEDAPLSELGKRLPEVADEVIDNHGVPGDAAVEIEGSSWRVASTSTVVGALLWNCLLTETARLLHESGVELPVFASYNMEGASEHNAAVLEKWSAINPTLVAP